jgi:hypothetical protein
MANLNLLVTVPASGKVNIASFLPSLTGGNGNLKSPLFATGDTYVQQLIFQNQGTGTVWIGDATTSVTNGLELTASGTANMGAFINYGTFLSDWWIASTAGSTVFILYIQ